MPPRLPMPRRTDGHMSYEHTEERLVGAAPAVLDITPKESPCRGEDEDDDEPQSVLQVGHATTGWREESAWNLSSYPTRQGASTRDVRPPRRPPTAPSVPLLRRTVACHVDARRSQPEPNRHKSRPPHRTNAPRG